MKWVDSLVCLFYGNVKYPIQQWCHHLLGCKLHSHSCRSALLDHWPKFVQLSMRWNIYVVDPVLGGHIYTIISEIEETIEKAE